MGNVKKGIEAGECDQVNINLVAGETRVHSP